MPNAYGFVGAVGALMAGNDAMLLGRTTYVGFAEYWPTADPDDPTTELMNSTRVVHLVYGPEGA